MPKAEELYRAGKLEEAIAAATDAVRNQPTDVRSRTLLFELLCFAGEYGRAEKHLDLLADAGKDAMVGTLVYRGALYAERTRREMFEQRTFPAHTEPPEGGIKGTFNGKPFSSIADADARIGPRLEVFAGGDYMLVHFEHLVSISMEQPKKLRDTLWSPAKLRTGRQLREQDLGEVLLPALAPLTASHPEDAVRLGRVTEWAVDEEGVEAPYGSKMLLIDGEEVPLLELRRLEIHGNEPAVESPEE